MQGELYYVIYGQSMGSVGSGNAIITDGSLQKNITLLFISTKGQGLYGHYTAISSSAFQLKPHSLILYCIQIHCDK